MANFFEHALSKSDNPKLSVKLSICQENMYILVKDNGPGLPAQPSAGQQSFGLFLVDKLVQEEKGNIRFFNDNGTCCEINLPVAEGVYSHSS